NRIGTRGGGRVAVGTGLTRLSWVVGRGRGAPAGDAPWGGDPLGGAPTSPPPHYNFGAIPVVASRHPLWDQRPLTVAQSGDDDATRSLGVEGALARETPITTGLDARPEGTMRIPHETYLPVVLAAGLFVFFL